MTDANGIPLSIELTGANRHDVTQLDALVDDVPPKGGDPKTPRQKPKRVFGDRAYDSEPHRKRMRDKDIEPFLAKRGEEHGSGLGVYRWVSMSDRTTYSLTLRAEPGSDIPPAIRLRRILMFALRACGLRCVAAIELKSEPKPQTESDVKP